MPVEVSQSWAGPYHAPGYTVSKLAPQDAKADPNADLYAAIPWAKEAGLRLVQGRAIEGESWLYVTDNLFYAPLPHAAGWWPRTYSKDSEFFGYYPTRAAAIASPPPMPPGYVAAKPNLLDELAEVAMREGPYGQHVWSGVHPDTQRIWKAIALSVARRLLEREPSEGAIEAFAVEWERKGSTVPECLKAYNRSQLAELEGKA